MYGDSDYSQVNTPHNSNLEPYDVKPENWVMFLLTDNGR